MRAHVTPVLQDCKPVRSLDAWQSDPAGVYRQINRLRSENIRSESDRVRHGRNSDAFPAGVFFAGTLVFREENWLTRLLHNYTALAIQRQLHIKGMPLVIMPMQVDNE